MNKLDYYAESLIRWRGDMKVGFDEEDGWFVQFKYVSNLPDSWITLSTYDKKCYSLFEAVKDAVFAHNAEIQQRERDGLFVCWKPIV